MLRICRSSKLIFQISIILLSVFFLIDCEGPMGPAGPPGQDGGYDKEIRLQVTGSVGSSSVTGWLHEGPLINFNKSNYVNVDSIIFVAVGACSENSSSHLHLELYDITNDSAIANSSVSTNSFERVNLESGNIYQFIPDEEITLGARIWVDQEGISGDCLSSWIFLYRN